MTTEYTRDETGRIIERRLPLYQLLAQALVAHANCVKSNNGEWQDRWTDRIDQMERMLPSGAGIDSGTTIDRDASSGEKLVLRTQYHHMNDGGYYDGWTDHTVTVRPSFDGIDVSVSGRNRNDIKDYLHEVYSVALSAVVSETADAIRLV